MKRLIAAILVTMVLICGCSASPGITDAVKAGKTEGRVYSNDLLKFSMTMPEGWVLDDAETTREGHLARLEEVYGSETADQMEADVEAQNLGFLLYAHKDGEQTDNILLQVANLDDLGDMTVAEYADALGEDIALTYSSIGADMEINDTTVMDVDGHEVAVMSAAVDLSALGDDIAEIEVGQGFAMFEAEGFFVVAMMSTFSGEAYDEGLTALGSVKFF